MTKRAKVLPLIRSCSLTLSSTDPDCELIVLCTSILYQLRTMYYYPRPIVEQGQLRCFVFTEFERIDRKRRTAVDVISVVKTGWGRLCERS